MERIGLIAGNRRFPILLAQSAKRKGCYIVAVAVRNDTSPSLKKYVDRIYWLRLDEFSRLFEIFKQEGIKKVVMAGQISPQRLFSKEVVRSPHLQGLLGRMKDKKADTIFSAVAGELAGSGIELADSTIFMKEAIPSEGVLTVKKPSLQDKENIDFGFQLAKSVAGLDIGQTVAVANKIIVAVEALEGTDNLIKRAGRISRGGFTLVKVSKPKQDQRFDIPVVGTATVLNLARSKAAGLVIEAGKTLFLDRDQAVRLADRKGLFITAL